MSIGIARSGKKPAALEPPQKEPLAPLTCRKTRGEVAVGKKKRREKERK